MVTVHSEFCPATIKNTIKTKQLNQWTLLRFTLSVRVSEECNIKETNRMKLPASWHTLQSFIIKSCSEKNVT